MDNRVGRRYLVIGFLLVLTGAVLPFLMVMQMLESTFLLNFIAYGSSIAGLFLGMIGAVNLVSFQRHSRRDKDQY